MTRQLQHNWCLDTVLRDAKELLRRAGNESMEWGIRIQALNGLSKMLEVEESKYEEVTGDVMVNMRSQQPIGALLSAVKQEEEIYDEIYESWIHDRHAGLEQRVAAMRFFLACLSAWQFQSPLTEPDFVTGLQEWATTEVEKPSRSGAYERPDEESCLLEARRTYATGLLAVALTKTEVCDEAVRSGTVARMVQDLERMALGDCDSEDAVHLLASSSTCDIIAAESHLLTRVTEVTQDHAPSSPGHHCEGWEELRARQQRYVVQCLGSFGEYMECLALVLAADGVGIMKRLLHAWHDKPILLADLLRLLVALLVHRRFAEIFVESGGVQLLLSLPRNKHTFVGLSFAFFGLVSVPLAVERVCALPTAVVEELVERALSLLTCGYDPARKNVALFFGAAIHFRGILDVFDRAGGLPRLLDAMRTVLHLLRAPAHGENRTEKQVAFHASAALRQYFRTHLVLHVATLKRRYCGHNAVKHGASGAERTVDVSAESVDAAMLAVETDRRVGEAFVRERWPPLEKFMHGGGPSLMLDFVQHTPGERYCNEIARHALEILQVATLMPECRRSLLTAAHAQADGQTDGIAAILEAAHGQAYLNDPEVMQPALVVLANCVTVPSSLAHLHPLPDKASGRRKPAKSWLPAPLFTPQPQPGSSMDLDLQSHGSVEGDLVAAEMREGYAAARQAVRRVAGIRMLLGLLHARSSMPAGQVDRLRALAVRCLLGLAHEPQLRHILAKLQVWRLLAQLVHEPDRGTITNGSASRRLLGTEASSSGNSLATFNSLAIDLINLTSAGLGKAGGAAAASDAVAPALHKIERAAIAASTHITYAPSELLVLMEDHLRASGLHASADMLAAEAGLGTSQTSTQADCLSTSQQFQLTTPFACTPALLPADSPLAHQGMHSSLAKRRALAIAPGLVKSIVKAPALARDLSASEQGVDAFRGVSEECLPGSPPATLDAAHSSQLADGLNTAGRTPAAALQSRRKRRAAECLPGSTPQRQRCSGDMLHLEQACAASLESCALRGDAAMAGHAEMPVPAASQSLAEAPPLVTPARLRGLFGTTDRPGCTPSAAAGTAANPLLLNLPSRRTHAPDTAQPAKHCSTPCLPKATTKQAISSPPDRKGRGAGTDTPVASKLSSIVMQYLRHQHKAACLKAAAPISTLPPMSLLRPNTLPQAKRTLEAPSQVHRRLLRRSVTNPHGGWGGRRQDRHFIYSRFRHLRSVRDEDSAVYRSCAFLGNFAALALGTHSGEIRIHDTLSGDLIDTIDAHDTPAYQLRVFEGSGRSLLLSSARADTRLWDVGACNDRAGALWSPAEYVTEPLHSCDGMRSAIFRPDGRMIAGLVASGRGQDPLLFDLGSQTYSTISMTNEGWRSKGMETLCFNPTGELLLFGPTLWDPRAPRCIHVFDLLSYSACCSSFHPAGLEAVVNSEVWDLRTLKLQRCVPCLDSTSLTWNASGDCGYATLRRPSDDLGALLNPKRAKQPLHAAFRTVDATDFSEIGTISTEGRCVLDLCVDAADNYIGLVTLEPNELMSCSARVYEVGRRRMQDDESDLEDGDVDDEDEDDEEEEEEEGAQLITSGPSRSSSLAEDASAEGDGEDGEAGSENGNSEEEEEEAGSADEDEDEDADEEGEEDGDSDEDEQGSADEEVRDGGEEVEDDDAEAYVRLIGRLREFAGDQSGLESEEEAEMSDSDSDSD